MTTEAALEGDAGYTPFSFLATLSEVATSDVTFEWSTFELDASPDVDYDESSGTVTISAGQDATSFDVLVIGDEDPEGSEYFGVAISNVSGAIDASDHPVGQIVDDDTVIPPSLGIYGAHVVEGGSGTTTALVEVHVWEAGTEPVTFDWATVDVTAIATDDYQSASDSITIPAGESFAEFNVVVNGDVMFEHDEIIGIDVTNVRGAEYAPPAYPASGTVAPADMGGKGPWVSILNDDPVPALSIGDVPVLEGDSGMADAVFAINLDAASGLPASVDYATSDGTALADGDYIGTTGTLVIPPGATSGTVRVPIVGDANVELDETFTLVLSSPVDASITDGIGVATIENDDTLPSLEIWGSAVFEGDDGETELTYDVYLSEPAASDVSLTWSTVDRDAIAGIDYRGVSLAPLVIPQGEVHAELTVAVFGDVDIEPAESFEVVVADVVGATFAAPSSDTRGWIYDDDDPPVITIDDARASEGSIGMSALRFTVRLSYPADVDVALDWSTVDGAATIADADYVNPTTASLVVPSGNTVAFIVVDINGDIAHELDETFTISLDDVSGATWDGTPATGTIVNDDPMPALSIDDPTAAEGDSGTSDVIFTVSLDLVSGLDTTVDYVTVDGSATQESDYIAASGTLTIPAGVTSAHVNVPVIGDANIEADEAFDVVLSNPVSATIQDGTGSATVVDDDTATAPVVSIDPGSIDFGSVMTTSSSSPSTVTITNTGTADLVLDPLSISGANADDFALIADTCSSTTVAIAADCTVDVTFTPSATGPRAASLDLASNAPTSPDTVPLTGEGTTASGPAVSLDPSSVDFGVVSIVWDSETATVQVTNSGTADLSLGTLAVTGPQAIEFTISANSCSGATVAPAGSCSTDITFDPEADGSRSATLTISLRCPEFAPLGRAIRHWHSRLPGARTAGYSCCGRSA